MKITKKHLKQLIKEELQEAAGPTGYRYPHIVEYLASDGQDNSILLGANLKFTVNFVRELTAVLNQG